MNVSSTNFFGTPADQTAAASQSSSTTTAKSNSSTIDSVNAVSKDEFLQLLVAQLKNQDPLEPVKNEAFLAQLATFSSLEQLVAIKQGIDKLVDTSTDGTANATSTPNQP